MSSNESQEYLFAYGILRSEAGQRMVFGQTLTGTDAALPGYTVDYLPALSKQRPGLLASNPVIRHTGNPLDLVLGTKFLIAEASLACADDFEQTEFRRIQVTLSDGERAWMYIRP